MANSRCAFPFKYEKNIYHSCTTTDTLIPWCSTQTDGQLNHVGGHWGYCSESCLTQSSDICHTVGGHIPYAKCIFPFKYKDVTYYGCSTIDSKTPWCSTKTDSKGNTIPHNWGHCSLSCFEYSADQCTTDGGPVPFAKCEFPFKYKGVTYNTCTLQDYESPWCSTKTTAQNVYIGGNWGNCTNVCP